LRVVVIGAGMAGSTCAHALRRAGHAVHVIDKSRGAGGRLASKRLEWDDAPSLPRKVKIDHGAPGFAVEGSDFRAFLHESGLGGSLLAWKPSVKPGSRPSGRAPVLQVPQPDMPSLCRTLLQDIPTTWSFQVDRLLRGPDGWQIQSANGPLPQTFDVVIVAVPPAQAAPLLTAHMPAWATQAAQARMRPCWTLMGVARRASSVCEWDVALPNEGPLAWVMRSDARPGRSASAEESHWVAHASADWSQSHLEQPAAWVEAQLDAALQSCLGEAIAWKHRIVHRWRYARAGASGADAGCPLWWDAALGLGVCGDFLGGEGVEGAWRSASALSQAVSSVASSPV
jgi:predicted NAD/FAD-dependent oxidoreductase